MKHAAKLPTSKAKNAYQLLREVEKLILAEPKRYHQGAFIVRRGEGSRRDHVISDFPTCGTIGCVAGWVATLKAGANFIYRDTESIAMEQLGLTQGQADDLFSAWPETFEDCDSAAGTVEYARFGVKHIRAFKKKHAAQLKARAV